MLELSYNRKYNPPSQEVLRLLELSKREVEGIEKRTLKCPVCGFCVGYKYVNDTGHRDIRCDKCKLEATIGLAYFRRQKSGPQQVWWSKELRDFILKNKYNK